MISNPVSLKNNEWSTGGPGAGTVINFDTTIINFNTKSNKVFDKKINHSWSNFKGVNENMHNRYNLSSLNDVFSDKVLTFRSNIKVMMDHQFITVQPRSKQWTTAWATVTATVKQLNIHSWSKGGPRAWSGPKQWTKPIS